MGFMGATWPCASHAEGLRKLKGIELAAVSELDCAKRESFVRTFGSMERYGDYNDMLKGADLDAVVIGLPTALHFEATSKSLNAGLHVLCEKPPTVNSMEMKKVARLSRKHALTYMFARQPRFSPELLEAKRLVEKGRLGDVYYAEVKWIRCRHIPFGHGGWFVNKAKGGGVLLDLGVHAIDNAWYVMGCPKPVEAVAGLYCAFSSLAPKGVQYTAEDAATGMIRFGNGATLHLTVTFALNTGGYGIRRTSGSVNPQWIETGIYGTKAGIDVLGKRVFVGHRKGVGITPLKSKSKLTSFQAQAEEFIRAIRQKDDPISSADQAVTLMQMLDALRKSGETKKAVRITDVRRRSAHRRHPALASGSGHV